MSKKKIVIFASTGFLGSECVKYFSAKDDYQVFTVNRRKSSLVVEKQSIWDGRNLGTWQELIELADIVLNFAGYSVNCRYNKKNKEKIYDSRILSTQVIGEAIQQAKNPPNLWINASTSTIYRESFHEANTEKSGKFYSKEELKLKFSEFIAHSWEEKFNEFELKETRKVLLRTSMIYGATAPLYKIMRRLANLGFGGRQYPFNQLVSWMHILDYCRACEHFIDNIDSVGAYNLCTPYAETNESFMKIFCDVLGKKIRLSVKSKKFIEIMAFLFRTESILVTKSRFVYPEKLLNEGFKFKFPKLKEALEDIKLLADKS